MVRNDSTCAATALLGIRNSFTEEHLYANGPWLCKRQSKIEKKLWHTLPQSSQPGDAKSLFFYDVTSSYFEGQHNELSEFGYNRDKVRGKKQVVMGLLTDSTGEPVSVSLFPGWKTDAGW